MLEIKSGGATGRLKLIRKDASNRRMAHARLKSAYFPHARTFVRSKIDIPQELFF
jgi:hypothetical protein